MQPFVRLRRVPSSSNASVSLTTAAFASEDDSPLATVAEEVSNMFLSVHARALLCVRERADSPRIFVLDLLLDRNVPRISCLSYLLAS